MRSCSLSHKKVKHKQTSNMVLQWPVRRRVNDGCSFDERCNEFHEDSKDQHFQEKFLINMVAANDINITASRMLLGDQGQGQKYFNVAFIPTAYLNGTNLILQSGFHLL